MITDVKVKVKLLNDYFLDQCKPINKDSTLPSFIQITPSNLVNITINQRLILDIIKSLNVN